jgi:hypothetical protein
VGRENLAQADGPRSPHRMPCTEAAPRACFPMNSLPPPFAFFVLLVSGWVNRQQRAVIDYLLLARGESGPPRGA